MNHHGSLEGASGGTFFISKSPQGPREGGQGSGGLGEGALEGKWIISKSPKGP